jgi:hypothetical protein
MHRFMSDNLFIPCTACSRPTPHSEYEYRIEHDIEMHRRTVTERNRETFAGRLEITFFDNNLRSVALFEKAGPSLPSSKTLAALATLATILPVAPPAIHSLLSGCATLQQPYIGVPVSANLESLVFETRESIVFCLLLRLSRF